MENAESVLLMLLFTSWRILTVVLIVLIIYRTTVSSREDNQIFIDAAEQHYYQAQREIIAQISYLKWPIVALSVLSGVLLLTVVRISAYQRFQEIWQRRVRSRLRPPPFSQAFSLRQ